MHRWITLEAASVALLYLVRLSAAPEADATWRRVEQTQLCVTNGEILPLPNGRLGIDTPSSRAVVRRISAQAAEIRFRYLGPTERSKPLASGELRRQIGLKLRAQDTCNLVYAMWHIEPDAKISVAVKRNPGQHARAQCGAHGYVPIRPRRSVDLPRIMPGEDHWLRAELRGDELMVSADGRVVWEGALGQQAADIDGPVGLRTDNARFVFDYYVERDASKEQSAALDTTLNHCENGPGD